MTEIRKIQEGVAEFAKKIWEDSRTVVQNTENDISKFVSGIVDKGKITPDDGQKILKGLTKKMKKSRNEIEKWFGESSRWALEKVNIPSKNEIENLTLRVESLRRRIDTLKKHLAV